MIEKEDFFFSFSFFLFLFSFFLLVLLVLLVHFEVQCLRKGRMTQVERGRRK